jgi:hypothetical protein
MRLVLLLLATYLYHLELALIPLAVDVYLLGGPVSDRPGAELLLRQTYVCNLLGTLVEFDSRHADSGRHVQLNQFSFIFVAQRQLSSEHGILS